MNCETDKVLVLGRRSGKTFICSIDAGRFALKNPNVNVLIVAPTERQSEYLFEATLDYLEKNAHKAIKRKRDKPTKSCVKLVNGSRIFCLPIGLNARNIKGMNCHRLYIDECSMVPDAAFSALTPMLLTTGGKQIYLSTPMGKRGEFYKCWINENGAYDSFTRFSKSSEDVIREREICDSWTEQVRDRALEHLEREKRRMSAKEFMQEYEGKFIDDLLNWFSEEWIQKICVGKRPDIINEDGRFYLGVDVGQMGKDASTFEIVEKIGDKKYVHIESMITRKKRLNETYDKIIELDRTYHFKQILVDSNGIGSGVTDFLLSTPGIRHRVCEINNRSRSIEANDERKVKLLKEDLYNNLLGLGERSEIILLSDDEVVNSLRSIQYEYVVKEGSEPKLRIFSREGHICEGLIRACWAKYDKRLNMFAF